GLPGFHGSLRPTHAAESSADFQSAVSQNFILLADRTCQPTRACSCALQIGKHQPPTFREIRNSKPETRRKIRRKIELEKTLTADCPDSTDIFDGHTQLKVAQIFNLPYRRISFCWPIGLADRHRWVRAPCRSESTNHQP